MRILAFASLLALTGCGSRAAIEPLGGASTCKRGTRTSDSWLRAPTTRGKAFSIDVEPISQGALAWLGAHTAWDSDEVDYGCGPLETANGWQLAVVELDRFGDPRWQRSFLDGVHAVTLSGLLETDATGALYLAALAQQDPGYALNFVWKLDEHGNVVWEWALTTPWIGQMLAAFDVASDGRALFTVREYSATASFRAYALTPDGSLVSELEIPPNADHGEQGALVNDMRWLGDDIVVSGRMPWSPTGPSGSDERFVARFALDGSTRWWRSSPSAPDNSSNQILEVRNEQVFVEVRSGGSSLLQRLDPEDGTLLGSSNLGVTPTWLPTGVIRSDESLAMVVRVEDSGAGGLPIDVIEAPDLALATWSPQGELEHASVWGGPGPQYVIAFADAGDYLLATGQFEGTLTIPAVGSLSGPQCNGMCLEPWIARVPYP